MKPFRHRTTLLELVQTLQKCTSSEDELVAVATYLVSSGQVELTGIFSSSKHI